MEKVQIYQRILSRFRRVKKDGAIVCKKFLQIRNVKNVS